MPLVQQTYNESQETINVIYFESIGRSNSLYWMIQRKMDSKVVLIISQQTIGNNLYVFEITKYLVK